MIPPLFKNQAQSIKFLGVRPRGLDTSDPGTGKTRVHAEVFAKRRKKGSGAALIVAPRSLLQTAWEADIKRFLPHLKTSVAYAANRAKAFEADVDVYIINTDGVTWLARQKPKFFKRFSTLITDEASAFKHHTSQRSKALAKIRKYFEFRYLLSGTPNSNSVTELWHLLFILDDGKRLGDSFFKFRNTVANSIQTGPQPNMVTWEDKPGSIEAVASIISDISIRHKLEDCQDIPANHSYSIEYELPKAVRKAYDQMEAVAISQLKSGLVTAVNAASVAIKLLQICSGAVYDELSVPHVIDTERYELIGELLAAREHSVVFFSWRHQRECLEKELANRKISSMAIDGTVSDKDRLLNVQRFQAGHYQAALLHPQSAAHGLTLTRGRTTIWPGPIHNAELWKQGNHRIYRAGQKEKTETITIVAKDTIEERVYKILMGRRANQISFLELLQELI